jgi:small subunit ribosomal protein S18
MSRQKKGDPIAELRIRIIDYKDDKLLSRFLTERGKILPRRLSGVSARHQRQVWVAINGGRYVAILPYNMGYAVN